jgi:type III restriction enzyme
MRRCLLFGHHYDEAYEPDFVVETKTAKYLCEPKRADQMNQEDVLAKAKAVTIWCQQATEHEKTHEGKSWSYLLIPDASMENKTLLGLASGFSFTA